MGLPFFVCYEIQQHNLRCEIEEKERQRCTKKKKCRPPLIFQGASQTGIAGGYHNQVKKKATPPPLIVSIRTEIISLRVIFRFDLSRRAASFSLICVLPALGEEAFVEWSARGRRGEASPMNETTLTNFGLGHVRWKPGDINARVLRFRSRRPYPRPVAIAVSENITI